MPLNIEFITLANDCFKTEIPAYMCRGYAVLPAQTGQQMQSIQVSNDTHAKRFILDVNTCVKFVCFLNNFKLYCDLRMCVYCTENSFLLSTTMYSCCHFYNSPESPL